MLSTKKRNHLCLKLHDPEFLFFRLNMPSNKFKISLSLVISAITYSPCPFIFLFHMSLSPLTFALFGLGFPQGDCWGRGWRGRSSRSYRGCGRSHRCSPSSIRSGHHTLHRSSYVGSCKGGVGARRASHGIIRAELPPLCSQNHHHL